jgi:adenosine deaminase
MPTATPIDAASVRDAPKVLLHDHLDGGLRPETVIDLADAVGHRLPSTDPEELRAYFVRGAEARDLALYLDTFQHTVGVLQTEASLVRVAKEGVEDLAADGVVLAEIRFAPELHEAGGLTLPAVVEAVLAGVREGEVAAEAQGRPIEVNVILCAMRTEHRSLEIVRLLDRLRFRDPKLVAFDLAGAETGYPPSMHADALQFARQRHLHLTIHASEPPDVELIDDAIVHGAERIGHGVRLQTDVLFTPNGQAIFGPVARWVLDHQIALEMAPTCHVQIGAVPSLEEHPIVKLLRLGFRVTVNTDNRLMSGVSMTSETLAVAETFDLGWEDLEELAVNGARAAFLPWERRERLIEGVLRPAYGALRS